MSARGVSRGKRGAYCVSVCPHGPYYVSYAHFSCGIDTQVCTVHKLSWYSLTVFLVCIPRGNTISLCPVLCVNAGSVFPLYIAPCCIYKPAGSILPCSRRPSRRSRAQRTLLPTFLELSSEQTTFTASPLYVSNRSPLLLVLLL